MHFVALPPPPLRNPYTYSSIHPPPPPPALPCCMVHVPSPNREPLVIEVSSDVSDTERVQEEPLKKVKMSADTTTPQQPVEDQATRTQVQTATNGSNGIIATSHRSKKRRYSDIDDRTEDQHLLRKLIKYNVDESVDSFEPAGTDGVTELSIKLWRMEMNQRLRNLDILPELIGFKVPEEEFNKVVTGLSVEKIETWQPESPSWSEWYKKPDDDNARKEQASMMMDERDVNHALGFVRWAYGELGECTCFDQVFRVFLPGNLVQAKLRMLQFYRSVVLLWNKKMRQKILASKPFGLEPEAEYLKTSVVGILQVYESMAFNMTNADEIDRLVTAIKRNRMIGEVWNRQREAIKKLQELHDFLFGNRDTMVTATLLVMKAEETYVPLPLKSELSALMTQVEQEYSDDKGFKTWMDKLSALKTKAEEYRSKHRIAIDPRAAAAPTNSRSPVSDRRNNESAQWTQVPQASTNPRPATQPTPQSPRPSSNGSQTSIRQPAPVSQIPRDPRLPPPPGLSSQSLHHSNSTTDSPSPVGNQSQKRTPPTQPRNSPNVVDASPPVSVNPLAARIGKPSSSSSLSYGVNQPVPTQPAASRPPSAPRSATPTTTQLAGTAGLVWTLPSSFPFPPPLATNSSVAPSVAHPAPPRPASSGASSSSAPTTTSHTEASRPNASTFPPRAPAAHPSTSQPPPSQNETPPPPATHRAAPSAQSLSRKGPPPPASLVDKAIKQLALAMVRYNTAMNKLDSSSTTDPEYSSAKIKSRLTSWFAKNGCMEYRPPKYAQRLCDAIDSLAFGYERGPSRSLYLTRQENLLQLSFDDLEEASVKVIRLCAGPNALEKWGK